MTNSKWAVTVHPAWTNSRGMEERIKLWMTVGWAILLVVGLVRTSHASVKAALVTMGRTTYPEKAVALDGFTYLTMPDLGAPAGDTVFHKVELVYGLTERWSIEAGFLTNKTKRDSVSIDRLLFESAYMLLQEPFQFSPKVEILPSVRGEPLEVEFGFQAFKNLDWLSFLLPVEMELEKEEREWEAKGQIEPGVFYRFGLNGVAGLEIEYESEGALSVDSILGGRVSKNVFLAIEAQTGLNRQAPDMLLKFQINLYFGPHRVSGLE